MDKVRLPNGNEGQRIVIRSSRCGMRVGGYGRGESGFGTAVAVCGKSGDIGTSCGQAGCGGRGYGSVCAARIGGVSALCCRQCAPVVQFLYGGRFCNEKMYLFEAEVLRLW